MAFRPVLFKDLEKRSNDLLTKEFPSDKSENKFEWKGETGSKTTQEIVLTQKSDGSVSGTFNAKYKHTEWGSTFTTELRTNREFKTEVAVEDQLTKGLKVTVSGESKGEDIIGALGVEFKHEKAALTTSADYGQSGANLKGSLVVGHNGFQLGGSAEYHLGNSESNLKEVQTQLTYGTEEFDLGAFAKQSFEKDSTILGVQYFQKVNTDLSVGAKASFDTQSAESKPTLLFGASYKLDDTTFVKGKFDTNGKLTTSWNHKLNKSAQLGVGATFDTSNLGPKSSVFGFHLKF
jgi:voltage-dependent anion channel protein 2